MAGDVAKGEGSRGRRCGQRGGVTWQEVWPKGRGHVAGGVAKGEGSRGRRCGQRGGVTWQEVRCRMITHHKELHG